MRHRYAIKILAVAAVALTVTGTAHTRERRRGPALDGYDPVAYFLEHRPVKGSSSLKLIHRGREWWFANEFHRARFKEHPRRYQPQYNGYCAWHIVLEQKVKANPQIFVIINGKLYLFADEASKQNFLKDKFQNIKKADLFWKKID